MNSERSADLCLLSAGIKDLHHHDKFLSILVLPPHFKSEETVLREVKSIAQGHLVPDGGRTDFRNHRSKKHSAVTDEPDTEESCKKDMYVTIRNVHSY